MGIQMFPNKRLISKVGGSDDVTIEGDLAVSGTIAGAGGFTPTEPFTFAQEVTFEAGIVAETDISVGDDLTVTDDASIGGDLAVTGALTVTAAATFTAGAQSAAVAVAATADGLTTGIIPAGASVLAVTSANADFIVTLPTAAPVGTTIEAWVGATGHEIRTTAGSNETINGQDSDGTKEAAIPATTLWRVVKVSSTAWILTAVDELGAVITAIVPD